MEDLRNCFVDNGYQDVRTYIQSGNVVFTTDRTSSTKLEKSIEQILKECFDYDGLVIVLTATE